MKIWDQARDVVSMVNVVMTGYEVIENVIVSGSKLSRSPIGVLITVSKIIQSLRDGVSGVTSPEIILSELEALRDQIQSNDSTIDQELRDKFDVSDTNK